MYKQVLSPRGLTFRFPETGRGDATQVSCVRPRRFMLTTVSVTAGGNMGMAISARDLMRGTPGTEPYSFCTGRLTRAQTIQELADKHWHNTFRLDCTGLGKPIESVTRQRSWKGYCRPMMQREPDMCALVSCTVGVDAVHRFRHQHNDLPQHPDNWLLKECLRDDILTKDGAFAGDVLNKIMQMGGVPVMTTNAPTPTKHLLPLRSWNMHPNGGGHHVAALLDHHGPCVVEVFVCPWYGLFDDAHDGMFVYRGCGRSEDDRLKCMKLYGPLWVGWHSVVATAYRFCSEEMHVLVLDNLKDIDPWRWVHVEELGTLYTLTV